MYGAERCGWTDARGRLRKKVFSLTFLRLVKDDDENYNDNNHKNSTNSASTTTVAMEPEGTPAEFDVDGEETVLPTTVGEEDGAGTRVVVKRNDRS